MEATFSVLFALYSCSIAFYMPTIALSNSVAYSSLTNNNFDTIKPFPPIRTLGTIGFICAMLFVPFSGIQNGIFTYNFGSTAGLISFHNTYHQFFVSAILGIVLFLVCFMLPLCPVNDKDGKK